MNRYSSISDIQKDTTQPSTPPSSSSFSNKRPAYKLSIPDIAPSDSLRIELLEPYDPQMHIRYNQLTFKPQASSFNSCRNPFSESYIRCNTVETTGLNASILNTETFERGLDSPTLMEIPSERNQDPIFTSYTNFKRHIRVRDISANDCLTLSDAVNKTSEVIRVMPNSPDKENTILFTEGASKCSDKKIHPPLSSKKTSSKPGEKNTKKHYKAILDELLQREKENRLSVTPNKRKTSVSPNTPRLGTSATTSVPHRGRSNFTSTKKVSRDASPCLWEDPKEGMERIKTGLDEVSKEKEYNKMHVRELKALIKKGQEEVMRISRHIKMLEEDLRCLTVKQKQHERSGMEKKDQIQIIKDEVLQMVEEVHIVQENLKMATDKVNEEKRFNETIRSRISVYKLQIATELKEKEVQKVLLANAKRAKQRLVLTCEDLEREKESYDKILDQYNKDPKFRIKN